MDSTCVHCQAMRNEMPRTAAIALTTQTRQRSRPDQRLSLTHHQGGEQGGLIKPLCHRYWAGAVNPQAAWVRVSIKRTLCRMSCCRPCASCWAWSCTIWLIRFCNADRYRNSAPCSISNEESGIPMVTAPHWGCCGNGPLWACRRQRRRPTTARPNTTANAATGVENSGSNSRAQTD